MGMDANANGVNSTSIGSASLAKADYSTALRQRLCQRH